MYGKCLCFLKRSADRPDIVRSNGIHRKENIIVKDRAGYDVPAGAVPVQRQGEVIEIAIGRITNCPNVVSRDDRDCLQDVGKTGDVRTWDNTPVGPVPMLHQRLVSVTVRGLTDGPNVIRGNDGDAIEEIVAGSGVGTSNDGPTRAVPVFDQRPIREEAVVPCPTDRPHVVVRDGVNARERIGLRPRIWTSDNPPIDGRDWADDEQSEQDKSGCPSDFHVVVYYHMLFLSMANTKSPPSSAFLVRQY